MTSRRLLSLSLKAFLILVSVTTAFPAVAAKTNDTTVESSDTPTLSLVESAKSSAEVDKGLDEAQKAKALEMYDQATNWLQLTQKVDDEIAELEAKVSNAPATIERLLKQAAGQEDPDQLAQFIEQSDLTELELRISQDELELTRARNQQKQQREELATLLIGSKQINEEIGERSKALALIRKELTELPTGEPKSLSKSRQISLRSRHLLRQTEIDLLKLKLGNQSLLTNLAQTQRDTNVALISRLQANLELLNKSAASLRESAATQAREAAEQLKEETANLPEPLKIVAEENAGNRTELERLVYEEKQVSQLLTTAKQQLEEIKTDFESTRQRVEVVGTSEAIGSMLYRRREALPSINSYSRSSAERKAEINRATDRQINIEELLRERGNIQHVVQQLIDSLPATSETKTAETLKTQTLGLVQARRMALNELQKVYSRYIAKLTSLDLAERQLVDVSKSYINYINDQLIWIASGNLTNFSSLTESLRWFLRTDKWQQLGHDLFAAAAHRPAVVLLAFLIINLLAWKRQAASRRLPLLAKAVRKIRTDTFPLTLWALFYTLLRIGLIPVFLGSLGLLLKTLPTADPFTIACADALIKVGITLLAALLLYEVCRPDGVGPRHLRWNSKICTPVSRELRWLIPVLAPIRFIIALTAGSNLPAEAQIIGRLAVILLMMISLVFLYRLLNKDSELMRNWRSTSQESLLVQLHFLWFPLLLLINLGQTVSTALGYLTLALRLLEHIEITFWFFIGLFFFKELLLRYLFVAERRLRYENALRKREELRLQREQEQQTAEDEAAPISIEIPELNFDALSEQAKRLVRFGYLFGAVIGTWMIWGDLLPALEFFNQVTLPISTSQLVDGVNTELPLTLSDLLVGLFALLVTLLAAKNLPGVLEITLLQRLPLDAGARYALTTLLQYLIAGTGLIMAFSTIGFQWSSIQWLVAALGVGLGFGLQEIVANFISGIILLFERPIRVGDVVTLDNTTGVVSRIRIRATTLINYDKQELLIPNKEFITGRVVNWTLTDKINRLMINVGVAYGSDVNQAMSLMLEAAHENDNVLDDPNPVATFEAFGDNTLNLVLRAYLGNMDNRLTTITALHEAINRKFTEAGINIAFPQRDLHLDTARPLDIRISRGPEPT
ncbi:MAG: mechanosensitive ion channel [Candidatus Thiodiazotropha sp. (ex Myrtea sp. 'scaly one' KF741663)]|nr:mechanosensitive ion channel [Candidatus Thiodiazotropha sp. (ex Myrtea sp. 'scaly one' KF741663)]